MGDSTDSGAALLAQTLRRAVELHQQRFWEHAAALYQAILSVDPNHVDALQLYGALYAELGDPGRAVPLMERSLELQPLQPGVLKNLGTLLRSQGRAHDALVRYDDALVLAPRDVGLLVERSRALADLRRHEEAITSVDAALAVEPSSAEAYAQRGAVLVRVHRFEEALSAFRCVTAGRPKDAAAWMDLALCAHELGLLEEADAACQRALTLEPKSLRARTVRLLCLIPAVADSQAQVETAFAGFSGELSRFAQWLRQHPDADPVPALGGTPTFYLAYRSEDNLGLLRDFGAAWAGYLETWQRRWGLDRRPDTRRPGRRRVGIVSAYVREHSVYDVITRTFLSSLERAGCEIHIFLLSDETDEETAYAAARAQQLVRGARSLHEWAALIAAAGCDALMYPELGMDDLTLKLAGMRLADLQIASWGHPETTGLPTIDYYISSAALEPENAQRNYTEHLVQLPGLGCYLAGGWTAKTDHRDALGRYLADLDTGAPIFICPGTPFKYAPEHDTVLPAIAEQLGRCQFVFFEFRQREDLSRHVFMRLAAAFQARGLDWTRHLRLLPWLPVASFGAVCALSTAVLDTVGFSGFNTAILALQSGAPLIAWEGERLRARLASGTLRHLGLDDLVASTHEDYAALAVRLARDPTFAATQRSRVRSAIGRVYADESVVAEFARFLASVLPV